MEAHLLEWLNLLGRWLHLVVGIAWIGASFYFVWLDNHLLPLKNPQPGISGELWAVHGGGVYNARKYPLGPDVLPEPLHWFKWEAYTTWMSGFFLMCLVYYVGADAYLIDRQVADLTRPAAILIGLMTMAGGWIIYDILCNSPLAKNERALAAVLASFIAAVAWGLCHVFSGRGAYIHFGAMLGTIMVANVFFVIMPGQRELVKARQEGRAPDPEPALRAKQRSVHNTYFTLPVLFTMISNHYAGTYGSTWNWAVLIAMSFAGALIRVWFVLRHKAHVSGKVSPWPLVAGLVLLAGVAAVLAPRAAPPAVVSAPTTTKPAGTDFARVQAVLAARCISCHAAVPTQPGFAAAPKGVMLDTPERLKVQLGMVRQQLVTRAMPIGNLTSMTNEERAEIIAWIDHGAPQ